MQSLIDQEIREEGMAIFFAMKKDGESFFDKQYWLGRMMEWVMKDPVFKVDLFRFVDVLPVLKTKDQVAEHVKEYLLQDDRDIPIILGAALKAASFSLGRGLAASAIRKNVTAMAERFIVGQDINSSVKPLLKLKEQGYATTIDLLGEKALSDKECDSYAEQYRRIITEMPKIGSPNPEDPPNVSIKITSLAANIHPEAPLHAVNEAKARILPLLALAKEKGVFVNFDLESYASHEVIYQLFHEIILSEEFISWPHLGIVVQAYLKNSPQTIAKLIDTCKARQAPITVRLVKGAYWDYEVIKAKQNGMICPVFIEKAETDLNFETLSCVLLDNINIITPAFGSHNIRSLVHAIIYAKNKNIPKNKYEIQMLYGMADAERKVFLERGHKVRLYVPIGDMIPGMSYLVRRLLENTSQMGFIKMSQHDLIDEEALLKPPVVQKSQVIKNNLIAFENASFLDFNESKIRKKFEDSIVEMAKKLPVKVPALIAGEFRESAEIFERKSPNDNKNLVTFVHLAPKEYGDEAIKRSLDCFLNGEMPSLEKRIESLNKLASLLQRDRMLFASLMCHEVAKTWVEADSEVAEAIDFCRYYSEQAQELLNPKNLVVIEGEDDQLRYQGRGPTVVISPWNFPLAIITGMSVAAYVSGNPIIMKPAELSSLTAIYLCKLMLEAGFYKEACHMLPGRGEDLGAYLVAHPDTANICFTGSMEVGHAISHSANTIVSGQRQMKRVICEMGGKNAIIIDEDADLDEAVSAVLKSAFLFAGQKCSAASRLILVGDIKDLFMERLIDATASLPRGNSLDPSVFLGPVIDEEAFNRLLLCADKLRSDPNIILHYEAKKLQGGYFMPPIIIECRDPKHWVMQKELFGPILAVIAVPSIEEALKVANNTPFALTGAIFSRSPTNIEKARKHFMVGNLYINQKCTGAMVLRQPFGGFKMSGTGIKAGGPYYLLNFVDSRAISENTMRRGFAPELPKED